jgi:hypothetical protein
MAWPHDGTAKPSGEFMTHDGENAMISHRPAPKSQTKVRGSKRSMIGAGIGLAVLLGAMFTVGMAIGSTSIYRNIAIAVLGGP